MLRRSLSHVAAAVVAVAVMTAACDTGDGRTMRPPTSDERANVPTTTTTTSTVPFAPPDIEGGLPGASLAPPLPSAVATTAVTTTPAVAVPLALTVPWADGGPIDARFTCDGDDLSPPVTWTAPPAGTVELALLVTDDDAAGYVHWAVAGIPPTAGEKGEGATITGAFEGINDSGVAGWSGPCPPSGAPHTYRFTLYALAQQAEFPDGFTGAELAAIAGPAAIAVAEVTGTYARAA